MTTHRVFYVHNLFILCVLVLAIIFGCAKRQTLDYRYEVGWVEPQIVVSDSLFTLIRAERIDSFLVKQPSNVPNTVAPSVTFHIKDDECFTTVNLLTATGEVVRPLLVRNLNPGYYKLTVDFSQVSWELYPFNDFYLKADYCGTSVSQLIRR